MIGIYQSRDRLQFCLNGPDGSARVLERVFDPERDRCEQIPGLFAEAQKELGFKAQDDFRVLADWPMSHAVARSVPFPESQLPKVLESFLEEELPEEVEDYFFDYKLLGAGGGSCAVLGFWMERGFLAAWSRLADELSLNSLDIQPAELALLTPPDDPALVLRTDPSGAVRYSCLLLKDGVPSLTAGRLSGGLEPARLARLLGFSAVPWQDVPVLRAGRSLEGLAGALAKGLGVGRVEVDAGPDAEREFFCRWAAGDGLAPARMFSFRRGPYAQKGLHEKVVFPVLLLVLGLIFLMEAAAWRSYQQNRLAAEQAARLTAQKEKVWKTLFKDEKPPPQMLTVMKKRLEEMLKSDQDLDEGYDSALQKAGQLFQYLLEPTKEAQVGSVNVGPQSLSVRGKAPTPEAAAAVEKALATQSDFNKPTFNTDRIMENDQQVFKFTLSTSFIKPGEKKP